MLGGKTACSMCFGDRDGNVCKFTLTVSRHLEHEKKFRRLIMFGFVREIHPQITFRQCFNEASFTLFATDFELPLHTDKRENNYHLQNGKFACY